MILEHFVSNYTKLANDRKTEAIPPLALDVAQTQSVIAILQDSKHDQKEREFCKDLLINRVNPGVDDAAKLKAEFLGKIALGGISSDLFSKVDAIKYLGTMLGGYNCPFLIEALQNSDEEVAKAAAEGLKHTLLVYDGFNIIADLSKDSANNLAKKLAKEVLQSWANAEWFLAKKPLAEEIKLAVLKIDGETNTDDLSPASQYLP